MKKLVYNLQFPPRCPAMTIYGYKFSRTKDYADQILRLQHLVTVYSEFKLTANTGQHAITAHVEIPEHEDKPILEWANEDATALSDVLLLLSIFTGRDVFEIEEKDIEDGIVLTDADSRQYQWGDILVCSIPYKQLPSPPDTLEFGYDIGREEGLNQIYSLMRSEEWQRKYEHGYFLFLAKQAFHRQSLEAAFTQCWTIWEHLFTVHNRAWLSDNQIRQLDSFEKIAFILTHYALKDAVDEQSRKRIKTLAEIRNRLIHFGKFPERNSVQNDAILFVHLTEFVIAKILGLSPSNLFNTMEKLEKFLSDISKSTDKMSIKCSTPA